MVKSNSFPSLHATRAWRLAVALLVFVVISVLVFCLALGLREMLLNSRSAAGVGGLLSAHPILILLALLTAALLTGVATSRTQSHHLLGQLAKQRSEAFEAEKLRSAQLEAEAQARSELLGMMSHELLSSVQVIVASADVLGFPILNDERDQAVLRIRRASSVLSARLRDLLILTRGEAAKLEIVPQSFEVRALVEGIANAAAANAAEKCLDLRTEVPQLPIFVMADASRISQILLNLVGNAIKYTERGHVTLQLDPAASASDRLVFHVSDTGPGIAPSEIETAFQAFERVGVVGPAGESAGVGLTVVRTLVKLLGGTIEVDSVVGRGTRFSVCLPVVMESPDALHGEIQPSNALLIVGAEHSTCGELQVVMAGLGRFCETTGTAGSAMNFLASRTYEIVIVDVDVLGQDAFRLATDTRRREGPNRCTYFVAIGTRAVGEKLVDMPFDCFLDKPIEKPLLEEALARSSSASRQ